jgi:hypothetical protein
MNMPFIKGGAILLAPYFLNLWSQRHLRIKNKSVTFAKLLKSPYYKYKSSTVAVPIKIIIAPKYTSIKSLAQAQPAVIHDFESARVRMSNIIKSLAKTKRAVSARCVFKTND